MSERNSALAARDQDKVWDFYQKQTKGASIFDYAFEDFVFEDYDPHPASKATITT